MKAKKVALNFAVFCIASLAALLLLAGIVQLIFIKEKNYFPEGLFVSDPEINYKMQPGFKGRISNYGEFDIEIRVNSQGFRDQEFTQCDYAFLGDSNTAAITVEQQQSFVEVFQQLKQKEACNFGMPGAGTIDALNIYQKVAKNYNPETVILAFYGNDFEDNSKYISCNNSYSVYRGFLIDCENEVSYFTINYIANKIKLYKKAKELYSAVKKPTIQAISKSMPTYKATEAALLDLQKEVESNNQEFIIAILPRKRGTTLEQDPNTLLIEHFCETNNINCINLQEALLAQDKTFLEKDPHMTVRGNTIVAQELAKFTS